MMAAEAGGEEGGPVTAGAAGGGAAAASGAYPAACRVKIPAALPVTAAAPFPGLAEAGVAATLGGGAALGSGFLGPGSVAGAPGGPGLSAGGAAAGVAGVAAAAPGGEMAVAKGTTSLPAETFGAGGGFPPLPPPPPQLPPLGAGLGTVDEGDSLDGPEYEEEEVAIPLTAPPTNQWYHGKLDRTMAEERLRQAGKSGSYLIRESDRRPGSFVLSFLSQTNVVNHFSFLKGDMFIVHNELEDGWMWVTNLRTDEQGLIVEDLVEEVGREEDPHEGKIWFHGKISKQEAYNLLMTVGQVCSFLVRPSDNTPGDYSLYFRTSENIQRFKICPTPNNQFMMGGRYYNSIGDIIDHYRKEQIVEGYYLKEPVPMQDQEQVLNDAVDGKEIYNTIRRKTKDAFYKNIVKKGYLLKKGKGKRWKNLYFILEGSDAQLIYFESEKRATKPKGLIDLSVCSVYVVHDSLFGRPNCFQIVVQHFSEEHYIFYFAGETPEQAEVSSLVLHIEEAHKLPVKHFTNPYCNIYLNSVQVAKTHAREGQNPVWSEEFVFDDLPPDINRFEITLSNKTKKSKDPDIYEATTLFRATTLASTLMEQYMKATATQFVHHALKDSILKIMESKQSCELSPSKLEKNEDVNTNLAHLLNILSELVEKIFMASEILPPGFVFLRLICPAILNPRMFNIISDSPSPIAARTLTLVAKSVQNLANLVEFGAKEPYMEGVNPFIKSNKHRMIMFLDELGNVPELPDTTEHSRTDLSRDLAALHEICVAHSDELRTLSNERGAQQHVLKKLLAITELLQQKQNQYTKTNDVR
ncbi:hypothetical protein G4228_006469 [Cervus hanglu yarkandensis]|nr:hypothetical protein G4228_006469 [Cervus hanglu yarkandensis]